MQVKLFNYYQMMKRSRIWEILLVGVSFCIFLSCSGTKKEVTETKDPLQTTAPNSLGIGDKIPDILGYNEDNHPVLSDDYRGNKIVLYFYPKDETPGCTTQACSLRDNYENLMNQGYIVFGVSTDSISSHKAFIEKENLPFSLIADTDTVLIKKFNAIENGKPIRITFLIDEEGIIVDEILPSNIDVKNHATQILNLNK